MTTRFITRFAAGLAALFVAIFGMSSIVLAQSSDELDGTKIEFIRQRCSSSQFSLQQISKRDAVSRINRGRAYDQMLRQISALNSRFAYNKISSPDLLQITTDLQNGIDKFRTDYDRYDNDMSDAEKINCKEKPVEFYQLVVKARQDRTTVAEQIEETSQLMKNYRDAVENYKDTVQ